MPTRVLMLRCGRRLSGIELVCINLGELATPGAKKFFQNTCPLGPLGPVQS